MPRPDSARASPSLPPAAPECAEKNPTHAPASRANFAIPPPAQNFSSKKRPRQNAWRELQKELDDQERLEEENEAKFARMDALRARTALEDELDPQKLYAYADFVIGRDQGKDPQLTKGRLVFELFDDIMPRTVEKFCQMLENEHEVLGLGFGF